MYEFARFGPHGPAAARHLVEQHPFALLVSQGTDTPVASHTPIIPGAPLSDDLVGAELLGHVAKINPQWKDLAATGRALLIFQGPNGYVSPTTYAVPQQVPTWDYAAVHLEADVEVVTDDAENLTIVRETVAYIEASTGAPWDMAESLPVFERIIGQVVGFRFRVTAVSRLFKLSQDQPAEVHARVLADAERHGDAERAALMRRWTP